MQSNTDFVSDENRDVHKRMKSKAYQLTLKLVVHTLIKTKDALKNSGPSSIAKELHSICLVESGQGIAQQWLAALLFKSISASASSRNLPTGVASEVCQIAT